jgi:hypothetical protein
LGGLEGEIIVRFSTDGESFTGFKGIFSIAQERPLLEWISKRF